MTMYAYGINSHSFGLGAINRANEAINQALERLATGTRINRASDDPSGLVAVTALDAELAQLEAGIEGKERANHRLAAQEGAMSVLSDLLIELDGIVVTAAGGAGRSPEELEGLQIEADSIIQAIDHLSYTSRFNGEMLMDGYGSAALAGGSIAALATGGEFNLVDGNLEGAQDAVESAVKAIATKRGAIGARQQGLESDINEMMSRFANISGMASDIRDADVATEVSNLVRGQILQQASIQAVLIGRQSAEGTLALLSNVTGQPTAPLGL